MDMKRIMSAFLLVGAILATAGPIHSAGYEILHDFEGGNDDGGYPYGHLTLNGSTLYGMTADGGDSDFGTVFSISTGGSDFTLLHEFEGDDGIAPEGSLIADSGKLYGMTSTGGGGDSSSGTIFVIPEPATLGLVLPGGLAMLRRR